MIRLSQKKKIGIGVIVIILLVLSTRFYVFTTGNRFIVNEADLEQRSTCLDLIVLGSRAYTSDRMSGILQERALVALDLYQRGLVCRILVSGDGHGVTGGGDEVLAVVSFLTSNGVPQDMILEDREGYDTFQSMKNAKDRHDLKTVLIVTQQFHLPRSIFIARNVGLDAYGFVSYVYPYRNVLERARNHLREIPAAIKAIIEVNMYKHL